MTKPEPGSGASRGDDSPRGDQLYGGQPHGDQPYDQAGVDQSPGAGMQRGIGLPTDHGGLPPGPGGNLSTPANAPPPGPAPQEGQPTVVLANFSDYASAQRVVDYLSDNHFPVERISIIGTDLRMVENVLGRMTIGRAALAGLGTGAWFGLLVGLLFGIFSVSAWWAVLVVAVAIGAAWGAIFGAVAHGATGGRRDFSSRSTLQAAQYAITVDANLVDQARQLLMRLQWRTS